MQNLNAEISIGTESPVEFDTSFILFFLAMDIGRNPFSFESLFMVPVLAIVLVAPFLITASGDQSLLSWIGGRAAIGFAGIIAGAAFSVFLGTLIPESFAVLPFALVVVASLVTVLFSFASLLGFRLVR